MTVEELLEDLRLLPPTARVVIRIRKNESYDGALKPLYEWRPADIEGARYDLGEVVIDLDE